MNKLYNTQEDIASGFSKFLHTVNPNMLVFTAEYEENYENM